MTDNTLMPTDAELMQVIKDVAKHSAINRDGSTSLRIARAVLAKWGTPAPAIQPVAVPAGMEPYAQHAIWHEDNCTGLDWTQYHDASDPMPKTWDDEAPDVVVDLFTAAQVQAMLAAVPRNATLYNPDDVHFSHLHDLTWSQNNAAGDGIEYVRADLAARAPAPASHPYAYEFSRSNEDGTHSLHIERNELQEGVLRWWERIGPPKDAITDRPIKALYETPQAHPVAAPEPHYGNGRYLGFARHNDAYSVAQVQAMFAAVPRNATLYNPDDVAFPTQRSADGADALPPELASIAKQASTAAAQKGGQHEF